MNKKVLTLCAGLLLVGSMLSTADATSFVAKNVQEVALAAGEKHAIDEGQYFKIHRSEWKAAPATNSWNSDATHYLVVADGAIVWTSDQTLLEENPAAYWKIEDDTNAGEPFVGDAERVVQLVNGNGYVLTLDATTHKMATPTTTAANSIARFHIDKNGNNNAILCYEVGGTKYILGDAYNPLPSHSDRWELIGVAQTATSGGSYVDFKVEGIAEVPITAAELNKQETNGFHLNFTGYNSLEGNVFDGKLTVRDINGRVPAAGATEYYLYKPETDQYIVLTNKVWSDNAANLDGRKRSAYSGYRFEAISSHAWGTLTSAEKENTAKFQILKSYDFNSLDSLIITMSEAKIERTEPDMMTSVLNANTDSAGVRVFVPTVDGKNYVTVIEYARANDKLSPVIDDTYDNNYEVGALAPNIEFGQGTIISDLAAVFGDKVWNITSINGQVLSPEVASNIDGYSQLFDPANEVDLTNPEGQWLFGKDANDNYYFINRESGRKWNVYVNANTPTNGWVIRRTEDANRYEICHAYQLGVGSWQSVYIREAANTKPGTTENGYVKFNMANEANNGKYFSFETAWGSAYIGKDADDNVILTTDASEAIEFRVKEMTHDFTGHDGLAGVDTLMHITPYLKVDGTTANDTLRFFQYALYENFSEKYLKYDADKGRFVLSAWSRTDNAHEDFELWKNYAFVVKEKADGSYILVRGYNVDYDWCRVWGASHTTQNDWNGKEYTFDNLFEANLGEDARDRDGADGNAHKAYAASQNGTYLGDMAYLYNYNGNDRITMENTNQTEYMYVTGSQDTVKIALQDRPNFFLYEQGRFLGLEHTADVEDMAAAMLVDTAYVRNNTYRPQYLLAVDAWHKDEVWDSHPESEDKIPPHLIHPDTTFGRFLVNVVDSAVTYKGSDKTNPYIFDRNDYYRLAFIDGVHTGDKLTLNTEGAKTTIDLSNNNDKVCTFAFRYVDEEREGVKIETTYDGKTRGWLKYQNNIPVVTNDYDDAHVFLVDNTTTEAPTANESINAEGAVSVTAVDGAVVIKGAEGKNVVIATILGKVVANETVNSDNETIAVPAGIAVVSVDGESFKVVVK